MQTTTQDFSETVEDVLQEALLLHIALCKLAKYWIVFASAERRILLNTECVTSCSVFA